MDKARRSFMLLAPLVSFPLPSYSAGPMTLGESDGLKARAERAMRPKPPKSLRVKLSQDFAVLLMRSSYNALDEIDCIAMEQFQRDFFLIRQAEYQPYLETLGPGLVQQGQLSDPYYFDFISFAQYATISRAINDNPPSVFEEQQPMEDAGPDEPQTFKKVLIRRDPALTDAMLAAEHSRIVGKNICDKLDQTFQDTPSAIPDPGYRPNADTLLRSLDQLTKLFLLNGFAFGGSVSITSKSSSSKQPQPLRDDEFTITLQSPATLWSGKALQLRKANPTNAFLLKAATEIVSRAGYKVASSKVTYEGNNEISTFSIK